MGVNTRLAKQVYLTHDECVSKIVSILTTSDYFYDFKGKLYKRSFIFKRKLHSLLAVKDEGGSCANAKCYMRPRFSLD